MDNRFVLQSMRAPVKHLLINGLSMGSGGGFIVGRELLKHRNAKTEWDISCALIAGHPLHQEMRDALLPANCHLLWAPKSTASHFKRTCMSDATLLVG